MSSDFLIFFFFTETVIGIDCNLAVLVIEENEKSI